MSKSVYISTQVIEHMHIYPLAVKYIHQNDVNPIFPVLLQSDKELILVDCGYPGFLPLLETAANHYGLSLTNLTAIIITHDDIDHTGGLFEVKSNFPSVRIYASGKEEPFISGKEKSLRLEQAEKLFTTLPENKKPAALQFQKMIGAVKKVPVDHTFAANQDIPFLADAYIISTPGHTPGHVSVYLKQQKLLIAADAFVIENDEFEIANPDFTLDLSQAIASVDKLSRMDINSVICYHGGLMEGDIRSKLIKLASKYQYIKS